MTEVFKDKSFPIDERVSDLLGRMTIQEKVGQLFQQMILPGEGGTVLDGPNPFGLLPTSHLIQERYISHYNVLMSPPSAREFAAWHNAIQTLAQQTRLGIPITISSDPRHSFSDNPATALLSGPFSQWPETLGLAAIGDDELTEEFADIARQEYTAVGIRTALHPQIDLATEARWARGNGTFGEDADLTARQGCAYVRGFQGTGKHGAGFGTTSVSAMAKHFPGGGPQLDGEDPHFEYGREQVYPGGMFEHHLKPFEAIIAEGTRQMMPYYGMPVGTDLEEVGFGFNKGVLTDLLRNKMGFEGIICTDWGLVTDAVVFGDPMPARAWGVEHLSEKERALKILEAGADQFGGEIRTDLVLELVEEGAVSVARIDESVARLLKEKFVLGLFDEQRFVDEDAAQEMVGNAAFREKGITAQKASITILKNDGATLPLQTGIKVYLEGAAPSSFEKYATVVDTPEEADVAILRLKTPFEPRAGGFEALFHAGSLEFSAEEIGRIQTIAKTTPIVIDIYLERPAVLTPFAESAGCPAIIANYGAQEPVIADTLFGRGSPRGKLPFDLPRSMEAVINSRVDVPFDTENPVYTFGHGLSL